MALVSVLLAFVAFVGLACGLVFTLVPIWGSVFSFGAPVLALIGIVIAGLEMSAANKRGQSSGLALAGVIMNVLAFLPALVVAMTCGLCNACVSQQAGQQPQLRMQRNWGQPPPMIDAGTVAPPPPFPVTTPLQVARDAGPDAQRTAPPSPPPVPDMPPPPMAPGPSR